MKTMTQQKLLRPGEVAEQLNVSLQTLWRWRQQDACGPACGPAYVRLGSKKNSPVRYLPLTIVEAD